MIRRNGSPPKLAIQPSGGFGADDARIIGQSVSHNKNLRVLTLHFREVFADSLDQVVATSSLRELTVMVDTAASDAFLGRLARQLRTNTALVELEICHGFAKGPQADWPDQLHLFRPLLDAMETYNFTLVQVGVSTDPFFLDAAALFERLRVRLAFYTRRNGRIRRALQQLGPRNYHVGPPSLWPLVLETMSSLPTLLYRIVRKGNVSTLCDLVQPDNVLRLTTRSREPRENDICGESEDNGGSI